MDKVNGLPWVRVSDVQRFHQAPPSRTLIGGTRNEMKFDWFVIGCWVDFLKNFIF